MIDRVRSSPGPTALALATIFPFAVILIELATRLCAGALFDPIPTPGHLLLVMAVPLINLLLWRALQGEAPPPRWLVLAGGGACFIAGGYALIFLPLMPLALIATLFLGIGLLPFAPLAGFLFALRWTRRAAERLPRGAALMLAGLGCGLAAQMIVEAPAIVTEEALDLYPCGGDERAAAIGWMRALGDRNLLLHYAYGDAARANGPASLLSAFWRNDSFWGGAASNLRSTTTARELYYRVTGTAFNAVPPPLWRGGERPWFAWDHDIGGDAVGAVVPDLALAGSRIDGSVAAQDNLAYVEWTLDLANSGVRNAEARFTVALPEGAVATRATLWVNGEPREASIAGRGEARAAYQSIVTASRDPLLVSTDGAQRLLVQAFPVETRTPLRLRLRLGITAPFVIAPDGRRTLALPAIVERNFALSPTLRHAVWVEGGTATRTSLSDADLTAGRFRLTLPALTTPERRQGAIAAAGNQPALAVEQRIERAAAPSAAPVMLVIDNAADAAALAQALPPALAAIAPGRPVGMVVAGEEQALIAPAPWSAAQAARLRAALARVRFVGGQDDRAALAAALAAVPQAEARLVWLHGAQPVRFTEPEPRLEQALERTAVQPRLVRYQLTPGRALTVPGSAFFETARFVSPGGDVAADLRALIADVAGPGARWQVTRTPTASPVRAESAHLVRLWAAQSLAAQAGAQGKAREAGIALAHRLNLITPLSGAVVLERQQDYRNNGLPIPNPDAVPTVPEPEVWALLILVALGAAWLVAQHRRQLQGRLA